MNPMKSLLLAGVAALALTACGKKDEGGAPETKSSAAAAKASAESPLERSYKLSGGEPIDVDALFSLMPEPARPSYDSAEFDKSLGATVVTNLRFVDRDADDDVDFSGLVIERAEFFGVDMDAIEKVKAAEDYSVDAPFVKIFDKVRLFGVQPIDDESDEVDADIRIGAVEFDQFRLRENGARDVDEDEAENPAHFFNSFDLAGLYFKDFDLAAEDNNTSDISLKAPDLRFVSIGAGKIGSIIANDMEYSLVQSEQARAALAGAMGGPAGAILSGPLKGFIAPDKQRTTIDAFEWRSIDFSGLMGYGLKGEEPPLTAKNLINLGSLKATDMAVFIGEKRAAKIAETEVPAMEFTWLVPSRITSVTKGAEYDFTAYVPDTEEEAIGVLKKHGLDKVKGEGDFNWTWDAKKGDAVLDTAFGAPQLADFSMDFAMSGLELDKVHAAMEAGEEDAIAQYGVFNGFGLKLTERKLLDAVYDMAALQMGGTGEDLRQSSPAMLRMTGLQAAAMNPVFVEYINAVASFLEDGGTLEIAARPKEPVPLPAISAKAQTEPQKVTDLLGLKVTHKK